MQMKFHIHQKLCSRKENLSALTIENDSGKCLQFFALGQKWYKKERKTRSNRLSSFFLLGYDTDIFHIN